MKSMKNIFILLALTLLPVVSVLSISLYNGTILYGENSPNYNTWSSRIGYDFDDSGSYSTNMNPSEGNEDTATGADTAYMIFYSDTLTVAYSGTWTVESHFNYHGRIQNTPEHRGSLHNEISIEKQSGSSWSTVTNSLKSSDLVETSSLHDFDGSTTYSALVSMVAGSNYRVKIYFYWYAHGDNGFFTEEEYTDFKNGDHEISGFSVVFTYSTSGGSGCFSSQNVQKSSPNQVVPC